MNYSNQRQNRPEGKHPFYLGNLLKIKKVDVQSRIGGGTATETGNNTLKNSITIQQWKGKGA